MVSLNADVILHIGSFANPSAAVTVANVNKELREQSDQLLRSQFQKTFGETSNKIQRQDKEILAHLLSCVEKEPNATHYHVYKPSSRLERWKWIVGVENDLDREIKETYKTSIRLLENTQATSIIQLKNQMKGFWHLDCQVKEYLQFRSQERARAKNGLVNQIFFATLGFLFRLYCKPSILYTGKKLEVRSQETFAKMGGFNLNGKEYDVVAFHVLADEEETVNSRRPYDSDKKRKFHSKFHGKTKIGIFERQQPHSLKLLGQYGFNQSFSVLIGREMAETKWTEIHSEEKIGHGKKAVLNSRRHLVIGSSLEYRERTQGAQGLDRVLDQKLTQIMVEMVKQNKEVISLQVESCYDDLPILTAAGFKSRKSKEIIEELMAFRSEEGNKLFPPYKDYTGVATRFETKDFEKANVFYSRGAPEAWSAILQRESILKPDAAILPEYWVKKPNIVEE